jgi:hypothetical protein
MLTETLLNDYWGTIHNNFADQARSSEQIARGDHIRKDKSARIGLPEESEAVSIHERNARKPYTAAWIPK